MRRGVVRHLLMNEPTRKHAPSSRRSPCRWGRPHHAPESRPRKPRTSTCARKGTADGSSAAQGTRSTASPRPQSSSPRQDSPPALRWARSLRAAVCAACAALRQRPVPVPVDSNSARATTTTRRPSAGWPSSRRARRVVSYSRLICSRGRQERPSSPWKEGWKAPGRQERPSFLRQEVSAPPAPAAAVLQSGR